MVSAIIPSAINGLQVAVTILPLVYNCASPSLKLITEQFNLGTKGEP